MAGSIDSSLLARTPGEHGHRLLAIVKDEQGQLLRVILSPVDAADGTWRLRTVLVESRRMMDGIERDDELGEFDLTVAQFDAMLAEGKPAEVTGPPRRVRFELINIRGAQTSGFSRGVNASTPRGQ